MKEKMTRRSLLRTAAFVTAGAVLSACQPKVVEVEKEVTRIVEKEAAKPTEAPFEIVGWTVHGMDPDNEKARDYRETMLTLLHDKYPDATFKYQNMGWSEQLRQNFVAALMGGTEPDIIVGENYIKPYAAQGAFLPFDDKIAPIEDDLVYGTYAASVYGGKTYGVSQFTACFGFESNPNVVEKAGLDPEKVPETWSELVSQCATITEAGDGEYYGYTMQGPKGFLIGGILRFAVYAKTAQAALAEGEPPMPYFDNPKLEKVWKFYRDLLPYTPPGLVWNPNEGQVYTQLFEGKSAYQPCGAWHIGWAKDIGLENAKYWWIPIPDEGGQKATGVVGNVILSVVSRTEHPDAAMDFCMMALEDEPQELVWDAFNRFPTTRHMLESFKEKHAGDPRAMFADMLLNADLGVLPQWHTNPSKVWTVFDDDLFAKVLETDLPIDGIMAEAQEKALVAIEAK